MLEIPNHNYIKKLANGNEVFEQKLIEILQREFPEEQALFFENHQNKKYLAAAENVHKLKNKIGMLGLEKGYQIAVDFENDLKQEKTVLYPEFIKLLEQMSNFIGEL